jgi:hypothetical protein
MNWKKILIWAVEVCFACVALISAQSSGRAVNPRSTSANAAEAAQPDSQSSPPQLATGAQAVVPRLIKFSGALHDLAGKPITGPVDVTFSLYADESGGSPLWLETQTVQASGLGRYTVLLGAMTPTGVPMELFTAGEARWLGVQVSNLPEQPRVLLVSVPYAMKAGDAETLGGRPASAFQLADVSGDTSRTIARKGTTNTRASGQSTGKTKDAVSQAFTATQNYIPVMTDDAGSLGNSVMYQNNGNLGIGTTVPMYGLDVNNNAIGVGTVLPMPGFGGTLRLRDDTGASRWLLGLPGVPGSTSLHIVDLLHNTEPFALETGAPSSSLYVAFNGYVGIGTNLPNYGLDVNNNALGLGTVVPKPGFGGTLRLRDDTGAARWLFGLPGNAGATSLHIVDLLHSTEPFALDAGAPTGALHISSNGYVGVGTSSPMAELDVNGSLSLPQTSGALAGVIFLGGNRFIHACCSASQPNTFVGGSAGNFTTSGVGNTGAGYGALALITSGSGNTASGFDALLQNTTGNYNTAGGYQALKSNTTGSRNTASGLQALNSNTTGSANTAGGYQALQSNTTGLYNTATGLWALFTSVSGSFNTASGAFALQSNCQSIDSGCTGNYNTAVGYQAGQTFTGTNITGGNNTFLGANSGPGTSTQLSNATAVGAKAAVGEDNALVLGSIQGVNGATSSVKVGIGTTTPATALQVASGDGYVSQAGSGVIVKSPDGTKCARIGIDNTGALAVTAMTCP